jgi:maleate isomerase
MRDYFGYRKKFAVLVPSTNTAVETEYHRMCPEGVVLATRACVIPRMTVKTDEDFVNLVKAIGAATEQGLRDALTCEPDHVIFGYSAETFWDGKERSDREFKRYNDIAQAEGGCNVTFGAQAILDALACYPRVRRLGVISPYMPVGDRQVLKFLGDIGYEVVHIKGHCSDSPVTIAHESFAKTRELVHQVHDARVDAILQAGTNLYFVELADQLEKELGKPVLAINALTFWHALRNNGIPDRLRGFGSLLAEH